MANIREKIDSGWIRCQIVIEVLGKPAEYLDLVLKKTVEDLEKRKDLEVINKKFYEPTPLEKMFSTFTELELLMKDMKTLVNFIFEYMPSNVEILEPKDIKFDLNSANDFVNMIGARMHQYDAIAKRTGFENKLLRAKLEKIGAIPEEIKEMDDVLKEAKKQAEEDKKDSEKSD